MAIRCCWFGLCVSPTYSSPRSSRWHCFANWSSSLDITICFQWSILNNIAHSFWLRQQQQQNILHSDSDLPQTSNLTSYSSPLAVFSITFFGQKPKARSLSIKNAKKSLLYPHGYAQPGANSFFRFFFLLTLSTFVICATIKWASRALPVQQVEHIFLVREIHRGRASTVIQRTPENETQKALWVLALMSLLMAPNCMCVY